MNLSASTMLHLGSVPITVTGDNVNSSPRCGPCSGTSQPSSCIVLAPPDASSMNAWVLSACSFAGAAAACCAICAQYGQASQLRSSCCSHCVQNFFLNIQNPVVRIDGLPDGMPGIPGGPCIAGIPGIPG